MVVIRVKNEIRNDIISEPLAQKVFKYVKYLLSLLLSAFVFIVEVTYL